MKLEIVSSLLFLHVMDLLDLAAKRGVATKIHDLTEPAFDIRAPNTTTCGTVMDMLVSDARYALEVIEWPTRSNKRKKTTGLICIQTLLRSGPSDMGHIQDDLLDAYDELCAFIAELPEDDNKTHLEKIRLSLIASIKSLC
ncbi:hypothetical protein N7466_003293 [Penicillium verhagenii]|uniref:uncharacterized protein n=1 Tax=Penicillium verhagenii TaxID=1562060 RepID=UPI002545A2E9|nr:uncharacterized protein N7466_003293 [Penicillium verhagenii]KAJ5936843.1 hypothetical protein N7466_003293 [Penicillium verhagenii]